MDEKELIKRSKQGDQAALEQLLNDNIGLIISTAKKNCYDPTMLDDLIQMGRIGFCNAVMNYDLSYDVKIGSYAYKYIVKEIIDTNVSESLPGVPETIAKKFFKYRKASTEYLAEFGYEPNSEELADYLNDDTLPEEIDDVYEACASSQSYSKGDDIERIVNVTDDHDEDIETEPELIENDLEGTDEEYDDVPDFEKYKDSLRDIEYQVLKALYVVIENRKNLSRNEKHLTIYDEVKKVVNLTEAKIRKIECLANRKIEKAKEKEHGEDR